ncbi:hypothetical protein TTRE_0000640201 [Trichuris trichiura]|uniref:Uncharacterized protein n=1 Tax=Trichuris trichiura TaxID=36087 RepID=A0A077ZE34_TRITR|nr:hypothetical protein TTRE_0000640201 [Trichuris trichiura]
MGIVNISKELGGEGFSYTIEGDIRERIEDCEKPLTIEEFEEPMQSPSGCDDVDPLRAPVHRLAQSFPTGAPGPPWGSPVVKMRIPAWILDPYSNANEAETFLQEELIELQANEELKPKFKSGYSHF